MYSASPRFVRQEPIQHHLPRFAVWASHATGKEEEGMNGRLFERGGICSGGEETVRGSGGMGRRVSGHYQSRDYNPSRRLLPYPCSQPEHSSSGLGYKKANGESDQRTQQNQSTTLKHSDQKRKAYDMLLNTSFACTEEPEG